MWIMCISLLTNYNKASKYKIFNTPIKEKDEVDKKNKIVDKERKEEEKYLFFYFVIKVARFVKKVLKDLWKPTRLLFE